MTKKEFVLMADDEEAIIVDINDIKSLALAMQFKSGHIKAKTEPKLFNAVARALEKSIQKSACDSELCESFRNGYCLCQGPEWIKVSCDGNKDKCDRHCP